MYTIYWHWKHNYRPYTQYRIKFYEYAKAYIGSFVWNKSGERQAYRNQNVKFTYYEYKCNLFVYEMIPNVGYDIGTPCNSGRRDELLNPNKPNRPPTAFMWYNNKDTHSIPGFKFIGQGDEGKSECIPGDIITDSKHMGIVAEEKTSISASSRVWDLLKVVHNNWGFRGNEKKKTH